YGSYAVGATQISGFAFFYADASTGTATLSSGKLGGPATFTVSGLLTWTGGTMLDGGRTVANGGLSISGSATKTHDSRIVDNAATAIWTGTGMIVGNFGAVFNNLSGATFLAQTDAIWTFGIFNNLGTFRKAAGTGTTAVYPVFHNSGTVDVQTGTLALHNGGT